MSSGSTGIKRYLPSVSYLPDAIWNDTISHNWNNFSLIFKEWQCNGDPFGQFAFFCEGNCMHCHDWTAVSGFSQLIRSGLPSYCVQGLPRPGLSTLQAWGSICVLQGSPCSPPSILLHSAKCRFLHPHPFVWCTRGICSMRAVWNYLSLSGNFPISY